MDRSIIPLKKLLDEERIGVIIFLASLIFIIAISHPQIFLNDEWISTNQLAQIEGGHQFIINEGKYGTYENATPSLYFEARKNLLGYPIFLPLIALPALKCVALFGDSFDYWVITLWTLLVIFLALLIRKWYPDHGKVGRVSYTSLIILVAFVIFIINIIYYVPFYVNAPDAPREVAAIILTNNMLFAGMAVIIFMTVYTIFLDKWIAILGTLICMGSSSYLIWASSAKDHMLELFLFSVIVFGIISYFYSGKFRFWVLSFLFIGFFAWDRPEMGIQLLISVLVIFSIIVVKEWPDIEKKKTLLFLILSPFFTLIGAIPLFINNYLVSGNPLILMYTIMEIESSGEVQGANNGLLSIFSFLITRTTPQINTIGQDFLGIFLLPQNGSIGLFLLIPLFLIGILAIPLSYRKISIVTNKNEFYVILFLVILSIASLISYVSKYPGIYLDEGIIPDMRYLSPVYLALNLIGFIILSKFFRTKEDNFRILEHIFMFTIILIAFLILWFFVNLHKGIEFVDILTQLSITVTVFILFSVVLCCVILHMYLNNKTDRKYFLIAISIAIVLPFIWQLGVIFLISTKVAGAEGYTFWLPLVKKVVYGLYSLML
jgi:hypothetical protein